MKKTIILVLSVLIIFISTGCTININNTKNNSEKAINSEYLAKAEAEANAVALETDSNGNAIVYWASVGKKYHLSKDCNSLKNAKEVTRGTVRQAFEAGITEPCRTEIPELDY